MVGCPLNTSLHNAQKSRGDSTQDRLQTKNHTFTPFSRFLPLLCLLFTTSFTTIQCVSSPMTYSEPFNHGKYDPFAVISRKRNFFIPHKPNQFIIHNSSDCIYVLPKIYSPNAYTAHEISEFLVLYMLHIPTISILHTAAQKTSAFLPPFTIHLQTSRYSFYPRCTRFSRITGILEPSINNFQISLPWSHPRSINLLPINLDPYLVTQLVLWTSQERDELNSSIAELHHEAQLQGVQLNLEQLDFQ